MLNRVYADVILHTAKESAVRVLAADRRAAAAEHGAAAVKEEAVATLLRLKSLTDAKITEAETISLGRLRKIEELAAQLREAESKSMGVAAVKEEAIAMLMRVKSVMDDKVREAEIISLGRLRKIDELAAQLIEAETTSSGRLRKIEALEAQPSEAETISVGHQRKIKALEAQLSEAETISLGRLRKIEVLEAQLNEAEDIICSLRTDLKIANTKSIKIKNPIAEALSGLTRNGCGTTHVECQERSGSDPVMCFLVKTASDHVTAWRQRTSEGHPYSLDHTMQDEPINHSSAKNDLASNLDLPSIIMRRKEPERCRNVCTQRIRALEQNILPAEASLGQDDEQSLNLNLALDICENERVVRSCSMDSAMADGIAFEFEYAESQSFTNDCGTTDQDMADHGWSAMVSYKRPVDRNISPDTTFRQGSPGPVRYSKPSTSGRNISKKSHSDPGERITDSPPSDKENTRCGNSARLTDMKDGLLIKHAHNNAGNTTREQESMSRTPDQTVGDNSLYVCKSDTEITSLPFTNIVNDESNCVSNGIAQAGNFLKYTFQTKRKRASVDNKEDVSLLVERSALLSSFLCLRGDEAHAFPEFLPHSDNLTSIMRLRFFVDKVTQGKDRGQMQEVHKKYSPASQTITSSGVQIHDFLKPDEGHVEPGKEQEAAETITGSNLDVQAVQMEGITSNPPTSTTFVC